ncbi:MAG: LPS translocon maturation chaperone LptM [Hyphomonas sp.]
MKRIPALVLIGLLASSLAACGLTGDLQRPDPLIGRPAGDVDPATVPGEGGRDLPQLPDRPSSSSDDEEDELLGGPGGA